MSNGEDEDLTDPTVSELQNEEKEVAKCDCNPEQERNYSVNCINHKNCPELYCDMCLYKTDKCGIVEHCDSKKHKNNVKKLQEHLFLLSLPFPTSSQYEQLSECIEKYALHRTLDEDDIKKRWDAVGRFNNILHNMAQNCTVRVYGSTINGFGLKSSDVNIELVRSNDQEVAEFSGELLERISQQLSTFQSREVRYTGIIEEFELETPRLHFVEESYSQQMRRANKLHFELSVTAEKSWKTSNLLHCYSMFDKRARILGLALRKWASAFKFDNQENGTWPPHAFLILVIHYLQRTDPPVLPCFHEEFQEKMTTKSSPESKENGEDDGSHDLKEDDIIILQQSWRTQRPQNTKSVGELFVGLFRYYIFDFHCGSKVVSIRKTAKCDSHSSKGWGTKILAIEDPSRPSCNLSRSVGNFKIYDVFMEVWRSTYRYLLTPQTKNEACFMESDIILKILPLSSRVQMISVRLKNGEKVKSSEITSNDSNGSDDDTNNQEIASKTPFFELNKLIADYGLYYELNPDIEKIIQTLRKDQFFYSFNFKKLSFFKPAPRYCRTCRKTNHFQKNCPIERLPPLVPIPDPMPTLHKKRLNHVCEELFLRHRLKGDDKGRHAIILSRLTKFIKSTFPDSHLELFGSTKNGFGRSDCDLDICLTFKSNSTGEGVDQAKVIKQLTKLLRDHHDVLNLVPITQAKVPILKFDFRSFYRSEYKKCACDISVYNVLAVQNTKLLKTYCEIDERVSRLGFIVKHFAKSCNICDASSGSLSSYAYTLMTLHYLQQCEPPVIPVLQELYSESKPERLVDNWNVWFLKDLKTISRLWCHWKTNTLSVAELFVGFLRYYTEVFEFQKNVVCINKLQPLTKLEKKWTGKGIAIEDPFLLTHNLGKGVGNLMANFIKVAFCKGRNLIGNPPDKLPPRYKDWSQYFFDKNNLTEGNLPIVWRNRHKIQNKREDVREKGSQHQPQRHNQNQLQLHPQPHEPHRQPNSRQRDENSRKTKTTRVWMNRMHTTSTTVVRVCSDNSDTKIQAKQ